MEHWSTGSVDSIHPWALACSRSRICDLCDLCVTISEPPSQAHEFLNQGIKCDAKSLALPVGAVVCNPYAFFGQPQIWPRGYPLEHIKGVPSCTNFSRQLVQPLILQVCEGSGMNMQESYPWSGVLA